MNRLTDQAIIKLCHDVQIGTGGMDYADALTAIGEELTLRGEQETPQEAWIPVEQGLPAYETPVLIVYRGEVRVAEIRWEHPTFEDSYQAFRYWDDPFDDGKDWDWHDVTHWKPLPVAPPLPYQEEKETGR